MKTTITTSGYPLWVKFLFYPFYSLWLGWLYLLDCEITVVDKDNDKEWRLR